VPTSGSKIVTVVGKGTDHQRVSIVSKRGHPCRWSPPSHIPQASGVGSRDVLQTANVTVLLDLPGVGQHLIDQLTVPSGSDFSKTPIFNSFVNDGLAYINGRLLFAVDASCAAFRSQIAYDLPNSVTTRVPSDDSQVTRPYIKQPLRKSIPRLAS